MALKIATNRIWISIFRGKYSNIHLNTAPHTGCPKKTLLSKIVTLILKKRFIWDTWYITRHVTMISHCTVFLKVHKEISNQCLWKTQGPQLFYSGRLQHSLLIRPNQTYKCKHRKRSAYHQSCYSLVYSSLEKQAISVLYCIL